MSGDVEFTFDIDVSKFVAAMTEVVKATRKVVTVFYRMAAMMRGDYVVTGASPYGGKWSRWQVRAGGWSG